MRPNTQALLQVLLATSIWGVGFVAASLTLRFMDPLWSNALRFLLSAVLAVVLFGRRFVLDKPHLLGAAAAALALSAAFMFQTAGLVHTSVAKSSLITGLYCVITPLIAPLFKARAPTRLHAVGAVLAILGLSILGQAWDAASSGFNVGDWLTLGCAFASACHIHILARVAPGRDAFALNAMQIVFCGLFSTVLALLVGPAFPTHVPVEAWWPFVYLAIFSSIIAFGAQMSAQQVLSPSTAATLLLLESPFGVLSGALFLHEKLLWSHLVGGAVMLLGCWVSTRADA